MTVSEITHRGITIKQEYTNKKYIIHFEYKGEYYTTDRPLRKFNDNELKKLIDKAIDEPNYWGREIVAKPYGKLGVDVF